MEFKKRKLNTEQQINALSNDCNIDPLIADLLLTRGICDKNSVNKFLYGTLTDLCSPFIFPNMQLIVDRIRSAFEKKEKIVVYGDYDCDGVGAIAIFILACKEHGINVQHYIPVRAAEGYGLNCNAIKYISDNFKPNLILTVDCGINSIEEVNYAKKLNIDVIITDHHQPSNILPNCPILNPYLVRGATPLCGAGVIFMLIIALFGLDTAIKYIDICTISTIADIVPLRGDNRIIVKYGMQSIKRGKCRLGIKELLYTTKSDYRNISTGDIAFKIAPRINAAGRLQNANTSLKLLISDDPTELHIIAEHLSLLNSERQEMNAKIYSEAMEMLKYYDFSKYKLIMLKGDWLEGVVGIVCAKLAEYFHLPTILVCTQQGKTSLKGSARSIDGINLFELFDKNNSNLLSYGGHAMAAGISLESDKFYTVLEQFNDFLRQTTTSEVYNHTTLYDAILPIDDINVDIIKDLERLEPFGHMNPTPIFMDNSSKAKFKQIGKTRHAKAKFKQGELIAFDKLQFANLFEANKFSITYSIEKNYFNGNVSTQFSLKEFQINSKIFNENDMVENFCKTFIVQRKSNGIQKSSTGDFPILYVAYSNKSIDYALNKYNNLKLVIYNQNKFELANTLVVAPTTEYPFEYYSKIIFLDKIGDKLKNQLLSNMSNLEFYENQINYRGPDINELRKQFIDLKNYLFKPVKFISAQNLYLDLNKPEKNIDSKKIVKFIIGFYILMELDLITLGENDIICIGNKKVDISKSKLYNYTNG